jgi:hypothetical protein
MTGSQHRRGAAAIDEMKTILLADLDSLIETKIEQDDKCLLQRSPPRPAANLAPGAAGVALPPTVRRVDEGLPPLQRTKLDNSCAA